MKITDEKLSAFLDAELPEAEMEEIRAQIASDDSISARLAELTMVDESIRGVYSEIDNKPLPSAIRKMLEESPVQQNNNVVQMSGWKKAVHKTNAFLSQHAAQAASVALLAGFLVAQIMPQNVSDSPLAQQNGYWAQQANILETVPSGQTETLYDGSSVQARLTFKDPKNRICRQFQLNNTNGMTSENIACREQGEWHKVATFYSGQNDINEYQTASGGSPLLNATLDKMIHSQIYDRQAEEQIIQQNWSE
ncbi:anti-sigma factor family protein [Catenovulum sediminis]|uniref:Zinc-finger domain-containing protein n=1 Tax=Catenovulum sediminis TaxID=1740262 RepID=A0ABV1RFF7_9ALTE